MLTKSSGQVTIGNGQGKRAVTLLTEGGCYYPVISHYSYVDRQLRAQSAPNNAGRIRGTRPMHQTTMQIGKPPWTVQDSYITSSKRVSRYLFQDDAKTFQIRNLQIKGSISTVKLVYVYRIL